jgi:hypothetical protein
MSSLSVMLIHYLYNAIWGAAVAVGVRNLQLFPESWKKRVEVTSYNILREKHYHYIFLQPLTS